MIDYEILLLLDPDLAEEPQAEVVARIRELVEKGGGTFTRHDVWGKRKLAYEINHITDAFYYVLTFEASAAALEEATRVLRITDGVLRFMAIARTPGRATAPAEQAEATA